MTLEETRKRIMEDDEFVLSEAKKLQYLYGLKQEIRFNLNRQEEIQTESVAEHVYGMHILASYFVQIEDVDKAWDYNKIQQMITWHDTDELETGDIISHRKTAKDREEAKNALPIMLGKIPAIMKVMAEKIIDEYEMRISNEARFVKAVDKAEPLFECFNVESYITVHHNNNFTKEDSILVKQPYTESFPYINRFCDVLHNHMENNGFFPKST